MTNPNDPQAVFAAWQAQQAQAAAQAPQQAQPAWNPNPVAPPQQFAQPMAPMPNPYPQPPAPNPYAGYPQAAPQQFAQLYPQFGYQSMPQQFPPAPYQPPMPPAPPVSMDDFFNQPTGAGGKAFPLGQLQVGQTVQFAVARDVGKGDIRLQTDRNTKQPLAPRADGSRKTVMVVPVRVHPDNSEASVWIQGTAWDALKDAMHHAGYPDMIAPKGGDMFTMTVVSKFPNSFGTQSNRYQSVYAIAPQNAAHKDVAATSGQLPNTPPFVPDGNTFPGSTPAPAGPAASPVTMATPPVNLNPIPVQFQAPAPVTAPANFPAATQQEVGQFVAGVNPPTAQEQLNATIAAAHAGASNPGALSPQAQQIAANVAGVQAAQAGQQLPPGMNLTPEMQAVLAGLQAGQTPTAP
ncbi:MAG TPA: hypothetical protein VGL46_13380 [Pseudonocardiaceae bacterium]|jgi:hypothetical protein